MEIEKLEFEGKNILIVEDNYINSIVASKFLSKWGAKTSVAKSGIEAISLVNSVDFDLILMDLQMPEMDGYTVTINIRQIGIKCPIIALTADSYVLIKDKLIASGIDDYLPKPLNQQDLKSKIEKFIFG